MRRIIPAIMLEVCLSLSPLTWGGSGTYYLFSLLNPPAAQAQNQVGEWGPVMDWVYQGKHMALLPNGKVLVWRTGDTARVWDPATGAFTMTPALFGDLHCAAQATLADGRTVVIGGQIVSPHDGIKVTALFDYTTNTWTPGTEMVYARWYPTATTLGNGHLLASSGDDENSARVSILEVYDPVANTWRQLTSASRSQSLYPFMYQLPSGKVYEAAPSASTAYLDVSGTGSWTNGPASLWSTSGYSESGAMYEPGKIIRAGGGDPAMARTAIIDMNAANPQWLEVGPMAFPRRRMNLVILADGTLMAVGGTRQGDSETAAVLEGEIWNPVTKQWITVAAMSEARMYHSSAVLLADGRVLTAGGEATGRNHAQIYSPPYLFQGPRPVISASPASASYGNSFFVGTPNPAAIASVALLRPSAATHAIDMNQRYVPLAFTVASGEQTGLDVTAPLNGNYAPPGYYMLILKDTSGIPSVASWARLDQNVNLTPGTINGRVSDSSTGAGITGATVGYSGGSTTTNGNGDYALANVPAGEHLITASASGYASLNKKQAVTAGGTATLNFELTAPGTITGRVTASAGGGPIAGATITYSGGTTTTDANGEYSVQGIAAGPQSISAAANGYVTAAQTVNVPANGTVAADFALIQGESYISGEVLDGATQQPIAGATVSYGGGSTTTDSLGRYKLSNVPPGTYSVTASANGYGSASAQVQVPVGNFASQDFSLTAQGGGGGPVTVTLVGDAQVKSSSAGSNYGTLTTLRTRFENGGTNYRSYLKFNVTGLSGGVNSAKLRVFVTDGSKNGLNVLSASDAWTEAGINWSNAPPPGTLYVSAGPSTTVNTWKEIALPTSLFTGNGNYNFVLTSDGTDSLYLSSQEGANLPQLVLTQSGAPAALQADFTGTPTSGTASLLVSFNSAASTGNPTSWSWDFQNDGSTDSAAQNPSFQYTTAGTYAVKLTVTNASGSNTLVKSGYITVNLAPPPGLVASFTGTPTSGTASLLVSFNSAASTGNPTSWSWDFQNDTIADSAAQNPSFLYTAAGTYTVKLTVTNAGGSDTLSRTNYITVSAASPGGLTVTLLADAQVKSSSPTANYGTVAELRTRKGDVSNPVTYVSYLKFDVAGLGGAVTSAKLRIFATASNSAGVSAHTTASTWTETGITWNNAPPIGVAQANSGPLATNTWVEITLPASIFATGNGTYTLAVAGLSSTSAYFGSREAANKPQLILTTGP